MKALFIFSAVLALAASSPLPANLKYDQRQEGDWNVRADLENFVILIIPTPSSPAGSTLGLLDLLSKAVPHKRKHLKKRIEATPNETESFIESKTAPYHVDITKSKSNLAQLRPESAEELLVSPSVSLVKTRSFGKPVRLSRAIVLGSG